MSTRKRSDETIAKLEAIHQEVADRVEALVNGNDWRAMLDTAAKFPRYSFKNVMLILVQLPTASMVMPYGPRDGSKGWRALERYPQKGEKALYIRKPNLYWVDEDQGDGSTKRVQKFRPKGPKFLDVPVFDVSQTDGKPLPEVKPVMLEGEAPKELWDAVVRQIAKKGWTVRVEDFPGQAKGNSSPSEKVVRVREGMSPMQQLKTLLHEKHHVFMGHTDDMVEYSRHRDRMETEAESASYVVLAALGIDTGAYSVPYIASWSQGDAKIIAETATTVVKAAHATLSSFDLAPAFELETPVVEQSPDLSVAS